MWSVGDLRMIVVSREVKVLSEEALEFALASSEYVHLKWGPFVPIAHCVPLILALIL